MSTETPSRTEPPSRSHSTRVNARKSIAPFSKGLIRAHRSKLAVAYQVMDGVVIASTLLLALYFSGMEWRDRYGFTAVCAVSAFFLLAHANEIYRSWRIASMRQEIITVGIIWLHVMGLLLLIDFIMPPYEAYSRQIIGVWYMATLIFLTLSRVILRNIWQYFRLHGRNTRHVAIIGVSELGDELAETIQKAKWMGLRLCGFYDDRTLAPWGRIKKSIIAPFLGNTESLLKEVQKGRIDMVFITLPLGAQLRIKELIEKFSDTTTSVYIVPNFSTFDLLHLRWSSIGDIPVVSIYESPFYGVDGWVKRLEDVVLGSLMLLLFAIPMLLISFIIKLSSPGPIIFKQKRYGMDGRLIEVWKFRTMTVCENGSRILQAKRHDSRVTPWGRFLRRTSLDELPQLINVLQGHMSIVGPRPHTVAHNEEYRRLISRYMLRHKVKPGITGWAQINGWRGQTDTLYKMQKRVEYDLEYIRHWSLFFDMKIIFLSSFKGFINKNAF